MARKLTGGFPPDLDLPAGFTIRLTTLDASTGAVVAGVTVSNVSIVALPVTPATADEVSTIADVEPLFIPVPVE